MRVYTTTSKLVYSHNNSISNPLVGFKGWMASLCSKPLKVICVCVSQGAEKGEALSRAGGWQRKVFDVTKERDQEGREKMHERPWKDTKRMRWNDDSNHFFSLSDQCVCVCAYIQKGLGVWKGWVCVCVWGGLTGSLDNLWHATDSLVETVSKMRAVTLQQLEL